MDSPVTMILLLILMLVFIMVLGIFVWRKMHFGNSVPIEKRNENRDTGKKRVLKHNFTEDDRQAVLLIRELADIINTVERRLK